MAILGPPQALSPLQQPSPSLFAAPQSQEQAVQQLQNTPPQMQQFAQGQQPVPIQQMQAQQQGDAQQSNSEIQLHQLAANFIGTPQGQSLVKHFAKSFPTEMAQLVKQSPSGSLDGEDNGATV